MRGEGSKDPFPQFRRNPGKTPNGSADKRGQGLNLIPLVYRFREYNSSDNVEVCTVGKVLFWGQIFKISILMDFHVLRFPEFENHNFKGSCLSVCVCLLST